MNYTEVKLEFNIEHEEFDTPYTGVDGFPIQDGNEYLIILNTGSIYFVKSTCEGNLYSPDMSSDLTPLIKESGIYKTYEIY